MAIIPALVGIGGKLLGNIFGAKGKARRAARRESRASSGKKGLFGGLLKGLFKRKRNKQQRVQDSSLRVLNSRIAKEKKLEAKAKAAFEAQQAKASELGIAAQSWSERLLGKTSSKPLPKGINIVGSLTNFLRRPQEFQLPLDVKEALNREAIEPTNARNKPPRVMKEFKLMDVLKVVGVIGGLALLKKMFFD